MNFVRNSVSSGRLVFRFVSPINEKPLSRILILNDIISRPYVAKFLHWSSCIVSLNEMEFPIVLHLVDAKGQLNSDGDRRTTGGNSAAIITCGESVKQMFHFEYGATQGIISPPGYQRMTPEEDDECEGKSSGSTTPKAMALSGVMTGLMCSSTTQQSWVRDTEH